MNIVAYSSFPSNARKEKKVNVALQLTPDEYEQFVQLTHKYKKNRSALARQFVVERVAKEFLELPYSGYEP